MRINERAQIFFYFLSHFLLTISYEKCLKITPLQYLLIDAIMDYIVRFRQCSIPESCVESREKRKEG